MICGAFTYEKSISKTIRKIMVMYFIFLFASVFYYMSDTFFVYKYCGQKDVFSWNGLCDALVNYKYHLWYIPEYINILFISPLLVAYLEKDENRYIYLLILFLIINIIPNTIYIAMKENNNFVFVNQMMSMIPTFLSKNHVGYFVLGRYLFNRKINKKVKAVWTILSIFATLATFILTSMFSMKIGMGDDRWLSTLHIFIFIQAVGWFLLFKDMNIQNRMVKAIISRVAPSTFGIYIIHVFFMEWLQRKGIFWGSYIRRYEISAIWNIPIRTITIFVLSACSVGIYKTLVNCRCIGRVRKSNVEIDK